jgi:hypothetical protein
MKPGAALVGRRPSDNPVQAKFRELPFHALGWIRGKRKGRSFYDPALPLRVVLSF